MPKIFLLTTGVRSRLLSVATSQKPTSVRPKRENFRLRQQSAMLRPECKQIFGQRPSPAMVKALLAEAERGVRACEEAVEPEVYHKRAEPGRSQRQRRTLGASRFTKHANSPCPYAGSPSRAARAKAFGAGPIISEQTDRKIFGTKTHDSAFLRGWGQRRDEHEEAIYLGTGNSARCVFRGISRSRWQQTKGVSRGPGLMQGPSSQEVFRHPLHEAA
jgi:hypothetical protein